MCGRQTGAEIGYGELACVADDFAVGEMQTSLSLGSTWCRRPLRSRLMRIGGS
jgi:hypothetical protein